MYEEEAANYEEKESKRKRNEQNINQNSKSWSIWSKNLSKYLDDYEIDPEFETNLMTALWAGNLISDLP